MKLSRAAGFAAAITMVLSVATAAQATMYNFFVQYHGGNSGTLISGSDDPLATTMNAGDSFTYWLIAEEGKAWTVETGGPVALFAALHLSETGDRVSDYTINLRHNLDLVLSDTQTGVFNSAVHIGTNLTALPTGLVFDQIVLGTFIASATVTSTPVSLLPIAGAPEMNILIPSTVITYGPDAIPEPASLALFGCALAGLSALRRRRAKQGKL